MLLIYTSIIPPKYLPLKTASYLNLKNVDYFGCDIICRSNPLKVPSRYWFYHIKIPFLIYLWSLSFSLQKKFPRKFLSRNSFSIPYKIQTLSSLLHIWQLNDAFSHRSSKIHLSWFEIFTHITKNIKDV